jgi:hypothetical protein
MFGKLNNKELFCLLREREQVFNLVKTHCNDAVCICLSENDSVELDNVVYFKKHVAKGEYQQTKGKHSEKKKTTGKLFGLRKWDKISCKGITGFVRGKRSSGYFAIQDVHGTILHSSLNIKKNCKRLAATKTTIIQKEMWAQFLSSLK